MGMVISLLGERRVDGAWQPVPAPVFDHEDGVWIPGDAVDIGQPYELYTVISGRPFGLASRHTAVPSISEPRGLPADLNEFYVRYCRRYYDEDCRAASWLMVRELVDFDWDQPVVRTFYAGPERALLFKDGEPYPEAARGLSLYHDYFGPPPEGSVKVSWTETVRDFVGCSEWFIESLLRHGPPDEVRISFWFS